MKKTIVVMIAAVMAFASCKEEELLPIGSKVTETTVAGLIQKEVSAVHWYKVSGKVSDITDQRAGEFTLTDNTGKILVTGVNKESYSNGLEMRDNLKNFNTIGIKEGDIITIIGIRKASNGKAAIGGPAYYVSHKPGEGGEGGGVTPPVPGDRANKNGHLINFEIPYAEVDIPEGKDYSSSVNETNGNGKAYIYETKNKNQRIVTHTFINDGKAYRNYTFLYDYDKMVPVWLAYHMNKGYCGTGGGRTDAWEYDPAIPTEHQPNLSKSYGSGYNRGHMLASHARSAIKAANRQAFYYTNMTPQDESDFNTGGGCWNILETDEMKILPSGSDTMYVVTGCVFGERIKYITSNKGDKCAIPDEEYKCFMLCSFDSHGNMTSAKGAGYLMPNNKAGRAHYSKFAKTIDEIEAIIGYNLFANVPEELQNKAEATNSNIF